jgi:hypothetical protein
MTAAGLSFGLLCDSEAKACAELIRLGESQGLLRVRRRSISGQGPELGDESTRLGAIHGPPADGSA